jgi:hypothetical protein
MKKFIGHTMLSFLLLFGMFGVASASIIETIHLDFESGAVWDGTITFKDNFQGMINSDGYLNGGDL